MADPIGEMHDSFPKPQNPDGSSFKLAGDVLHTSAPANDNKNLQIPDDPYTMGKINSEWNRMVKEGNKPPLKIVPK